MELIKKFVSRRLVVLGAIFVAPPVYHVLGLSDTIILAVTTAASTYIVGRAYVDRSPK